MKLNKEQRPVIVAVHGWGFSPGLWRPLRALLSEWEWQCVDLGFFGSAADNTFPRDRPWVGIGHSLGFLWLLRRLGRETSAGWDECGLAGLVSINGFSRFYQGENYPAGVPVRIIQRMRSRLQTEPAEVLSSFRVQGGLPLGTAPTMTADDLASLSTGLHWLLTWDERPTLARWPGPMLVLASQNDGIVGPTMSESSFSSCRQRQMRWNSRGGHLLPLLETAWCVQQLRPFLTELG